MIRICSFTRNIFRTVALLTLLCALPAFTFAQTSTTGAISGVVTDSTGAVLPGATVLLTDVNGTVIKLTADASGRYSKDLLKPGKYTVSATTPSFTSATESVQVELSQTIPVNIKMVPAGTAASVEVSAADIPLLDSQNIALVTTFSQTQIDNLPTPGGDVTTVAFTLPGVVVNAGGSYGNFSSNGLPGISNLFVLNGFDNQDPFLNLNNSGSSNLTLGKGELQEISVVQNAYNSNFGRAAGAIINYTTKSGTNHFHGQLDYYNNTSIMNANGWFNNFDGGPRPHAVSNQWAVNAGGPIIKDKVYFFADFEGLRYVLPGASGLVNFPSTQLQSYILSTIPSAAVGLYQQAFAAYKSAPAYASAAPVTTGSGTAQDASGALGCGPTADGGLQGTPTGIGSHVFGVDTPCISTAFGQANNINKEWLFTGRGDWNINPNHKIYGRYKMDRGSQPTYTNFINPLFNAVSIQPEYEGQFNDSLNITPKLANVVVVAANWYSAYFGPASNAASAAVYPDFLLPDLGYDSSGTNTSSGLAFLGVPGALTQGRNVTQYQVEDDLNYLLGKHTLKGGFNFRRDLVTDYDPQVNTIFPQVTILGISDWAAGQLSLQNSVFGGYDSFSQAFTSIQHAHLDLYNIGIYLQDEFQALPKLKLTIGARIDRTGNPLCSDNCFSQYASTFPASGASLTAAYDVANGGPINPVNAHPFPSVQVLNFQPRFGLNYSPNGKTEIRGGVGVFSDLYPAGFLDGAIENFPNYNAVSVYSGINGAPGAGTLVTNAATANAVTQTGFKSGQSLTQINNTLYNQGVPFSPPALGAYFPSEFKVPEYVEYSLQVQQQLGRFDALIITYAGNFGVDGVIINPFQNPAAGVYQTYGSTAGPNGTYALQNGPFGGIATTPADPRFGRVTAYTNNSNSNYNGLQLTWKHNGHGLQSSFSYTYSHSLDDVSNGGEGENFNPLSVVNQLTPNLDTNNLNYSNSDYDVRNNFVGDLVYEEPNKFKSHAVNEVAGGWVVSFKTYYRSGQPFSVVNTSVTGGFPNLGTNLMPDRVVPHVTNTCGSNPHKGTLNPCLLSTDYSSSQADFGNVRRNSYYGPHYVNTDFTLEKKLIKTEKMTFLMAGSAFNLFNHPNFAPPNNVLGTGTFGLVTGTVAPPTSPYGSFQGAAVTQRVMQVEGKFTF
jgi:hypothetical protein